MPVCQFTHSHARAWLIGAFVVARVARQNNLWYHTFVNLSNVNIERKIGTLA